MSEHGQATDVARLTDAEQEALMWSCDNDTWGDHLAHATRLVAAARADERERVVAGVRDLLNPEEPTDCVTICDDIAKYLISLTPAVKSDPKEVGRG